MKSSTRPVGLLLFLLSACAPEGKDYDASLKCQGLGYQPGTLAYDHCVRDEQAARLLEQQRREMEALQRERQDQKLRQY